MTAQKFLLFAAVAVLWAILASPHPIRARSVDLKEAINRTVCPMDVVEDIDVDRIPQRIKVIRCAKEPSNWCQAQNIPHHECCHHTHADHKIECVEIRDTVLVYYKSIAKQKTLDVAVGCSCMIDQSRRGLEVPRNS